MRYFYHLALLGLFASGLISCTKDSCPYEDQRLCDRVYRDSLAAAEPCFYTLNAVPGQVVNSNRVVFSPSEFSQIPRKVVLEYYTGFRCANCPPASATARNIKQALCGDIVLKFVHSTAQFARPLNNHPEGYYSKDFRTAESETFLIDFQVSSLPSGIVNRKKFGGSYALSAGQWASELEAERSNPSQAFLRIRGIEIDTVARMATVQVAYRLIGLSANEYKLTVGVLENKIIEAQKDGPDDVFPYFHDFVFRGNANGDYGDVLQTPSPPLAPNEAVLYEVSWPIDEEWSVENLYIFAHLNHAESLEIIQADGAYFVP